MIDLSPEEFRTLAYRAVDLIAERLSGLEGGPARRVVPDALRQQLLNQPLPESGIAATQLLERISKEILPYPLGNNSPRFFAWVNSPAAPLGVLAELFAASLNSSVAGGDHAATYVEHAVLQWLKTLVGYPSDSGGILTSGGSVANLIGLAVMRHIKTQGNVRALGMQAESAPMIVYASTQGHSCIQKAVELLGLGNENLHRVGVDSEYRMDLRALAKQIRSDRADGRRPVCVVASAGTVNTGAIDPLAEIAELCEREGLWFHVDGAYGAIGILAEQTRDQYPGMERADSLAVDAHKWLYIPVECGCAFVRNRQAMRDAFSVVPPYLRDDTSLPWFSEFGVQQTRGFRALKLWLCLQHVGAEGYRELVTQDIALARKLQERIRKNPDFELVAAGPLSITCFRYAPEGEQDLDALNRRLLDLVQREGKVFLTSTELDGRLVLRACIVNFRTREEHLEALLEEVADAGRRVRGAMKMPQDL